MSAELLSKLDTACKQHDWTYNYSDDHRAWTKGNNESAEIRSIMAQLVALGLEQQATDIYNTHRPDMG